MIKVPKGTIHVNNSNGRIQYYLKDGDKRIYMKEKERNLVQKICQRDYDKKILALANMELRELEKIEKIYTGIYCDNYYENINMARRNMIFPIYLPDEEYIDLWNQEEYVEKEFARYYPEYYTDKGERVRSKSEILIANALNRHNVPYKYEKPLYLDDCGTIHPDFTILDIATRKEIYWEHMGMMDQQEYAENAMQRIHMCEKNHIFPGDQLIITYETSKTPLNTKSIERKILHYLNIT